MNIEYIIKRCDFLTGAMKMTLAAARQAAAEGIVMLENKNNALPLKRGEKIALLGRCQIDYNAGGTGSGGSVNTEYKTDILSSLKRNGVETDEKLEKFYTRWTRRHPIETGGGMWASRPLFQREPEILKLPLRRAAKNADTAVVVIGRSSGEEQDSYFGPGGWLLTEAERATLKAARKYFKKVIAILNVPGVIDMGWVGEFDIDAVLYIWQGGQEGGEAVADVLTGISPCGRLTDTIAVRYADYPSSADFGGDDRNFYREDIFVGYRYFETFCPEKVMYPFGFGLSYTEFEISCNSVSMSGGSVSLRVNVKNIGGTSGKEVVQVYAVPPKSRLPRPEIALVEFAKTETLGPGGSEELVIKFPLSRLSYYDDKNFCLRVDKGLYKFVIGKNVRDRSCAISLELYKDEVIRKCKSFGAPTEPFERLRGFKNGEPVYEPVPVRASEPAERRKPAPEIEFTGDRGIKLNDVKLGKAALDDFLAQLASEDLACLCRGEGMGSSRVRPGTGTAFGGVSDRLLDFGVPAVAGTDGPSGLRFDNGDKAALVPIGTMLACTWNKRLVQEIYSRIGGEMLENHVELLLGPGVNIHRNPLCGRNFEYFSEDPYMSGAMAAAAMSGLNSKGVRGVLKHIAANNREHNRKRLNSVVSERALREIYLKPIEYALELSEVKALMTAYNPVNGVQSGSNYDIITGIIRDELGFDGMVMTDWWAYLGKCGGASTKNTAAMLRAGGDIYMVHSSAANNSGGDNTLVSLKDGSLSLGELQRAAKNILKLIIDLKY